MCAVPYPRACEGGRLGGNGWGWGRRAVGAGQGPSDGCADRGDGRARLDLERRGERLWNERDG
jgi:hypothetical protein